jgi:cysteine desulfurase
MPAAVYLDHNATSPIRPEALAAATVAMEKGGNPTSVHGSGRAARALLEEARARVAALVDAQPDQVIFTSGGTEANNLALHSYKNDCVLLSAIEHASVLNCRHDAERLPVTKDGCVDLAYLAARLQRAPRPQLISVMAANNETGVIQPMADLAALASAHGVTLHCDAVQAAGKIPLSLARMGCDLMSLSAHKIGGPAGIGALIVRETAAIEPLLFGGTQEGRRRAGTENLAGIAGFGAAATAAARDLPQMTDLARLRSDMESHLREICDDLVFPGAGATRLPNTSCAALPGASAETLLMALDLDGIAVSSGAACSSGKVGPSHVLEAMGIAPDVANGALRISLGWNSSGSDIERLIESWRRIAERRGKRENTGPDARSLARPAEPRQAGTR